MSTGNAPFEVLAVVQAVKPADAGRLIRAAVNLHAKYGDVHDTLSTSQVKALHRIADQDISTEDDRDRVDPWDLLSALTTAVELYDIHGEAHPVSQVGQDIQISQLAAAIERVRPLVVDEDT